MHHRWLVFSFLATVSLTGGLALGQKHDRNSYLGKPPPEIVSESDHWIGASEPLTLEKLKGKVFWEGNPARVVERPKEAAALRDLIESKLAER